MAETGDAPGTQSQYSIFAGHIIRPSEELLASIGAARERRGAGNRAASPERRGNRSWSPVDRRVERHAAGTR